MSFSNEELNERTHADADLAYEVGQAIHPYIDRMRLLETCLPTLQEEPLETHHHVTVGEPSERYRETTTNGFGDNITTGANRPSVAELPEAYFTPGIIDRYDGVSDFTRSVGAPEDAEEEEWFKRTEQRSTPLAWPLLTWPIEADNPYEILDSEGELDELITGKYLGGRLRNIVPVPNIVVSGLLNYAIQAYKHEIGTASGQTIFDEDKKKALAELGEEQKSAYETAQTHATARILEILQLGTDVNDLDQAQKGALIKVLDDYSEKVSSLRKEERESEEMFEEFYDVH